MGQGHLESGEMGNMKERIKNTVNSIKQKTRFYQGVAAGLFIMSALSYAAVTLTTFTASTTISASDMNANFAAVKSKLDELDVGFVAGLTTNFQLTACDSGNMNPTPAYLELVVPDFLEHNDGGFNLGTGEYTIPATGIYRLYIEIPNTIGANMGIDVKLETYNGTTWTNEYISAASATSVVHRYTIGEKIRLKIGCGTKFTNWNTTPLIVDKNKFAFALKKF
jgi:hypothetical protein